MAEKSNRYFPVLDEEPRKSVYTSLRRILAATRNRERNNRQHEKSSRPANSFVISLRYRFLGEPPCGSSNLRLKKKQANRPQARGYPEFLNRKSIFGRRLRKYGRTTHSTGTMPIETVATEKRKRRRAGSYEFPPPERPIFLARKSTSPTMARKRNNKSVRDIPPDWPTRSCPMRVRASGPSDNSCQRPSESKGPFGETRVGLGIAVKRKRPSGYASGQPSIEMPFPRADPIDAEIRERVSQAKYLILLRRLGALVVRRAFFQDKSPLLETDCQRMAWMRRWISFIAVDIASRVSHFEWNVQSDGSQ
uniref:Uncharacterized protein n=1 Tax=Trichuris muris TaxID=70415 RepID=A0A5S6QIQ2_TRIMR